MADVICHNILRAYESVLSLCLELDTYSWHHLERIQQEIELSKNKLSIDVEIHPIDAEKSLMSLLTDTQVRTLHELKFPAWILYLKLNDRVEYKIDKTKINAYYVKYISLTINNALFVLKLNIITNPERFRDFPDRFVNIHDFTELRTKLFKFHSFTPIHLNSIACPYVELHLDINSLHCEYCAICCLKYCGLCSMACHAGKYYCRQSQCIDIAAAEAFYSILLKATKHYINIHDDVIKCIMQYCMGFTTDCCTDYCERSIQFNNRLQFENKFDCDGMAIYYYQVSPKYDERYTVKEICGERYRIFCNFCVGFYILQECALFTNGCINKDSQGTCCANCAYLGGMEVTMEQQYNSKRKRDYEKMEKYHSVIINVLFLTMPIIICIILSFARKFQ